MNNDYGTITVLLLIDQKIISVPYGSEERSESIRCTYTYIYY